MLPIPLQGREPKSIRKSPLAMATPVPTPSGVALQPGPRRGGKHGKTGLRPRPGSGLQGTGTWIAMMGIMPPLPGAAMLTTRGSLPKGQSWSSQPGPQVTHLLSILAVCLQHHQIFQKNPKEGDTLGNRGEGGMSPCSQVPNTPSPESLPPSASWPTPRIPRGAAQDP